MRSTRPDVRSGWLVGRSAWVGCGRVVCWWVDLAGGAGVSSVGGVDLAGGVGVSSVRGVDSPGGVGVSSAGGVDTSVSSGDLPRDSVERGWVARLAGESAPRDCGGGLVRAPIPVLCADPLVRGCGPWRRSACRRPVRSTRPRVGGLALDRAWGGTAGSRSNRLDIGDLCGLRVIKQPMDWPVDEASGDLAVLLACFAGWLLALRLLLCGPQRGWRSPVWSVPAAMLSGRKGGGFDEFR